MGNVVGLFPLAAAEQGLNFFEILIWPGGGPIGLVLWCLSIVMVALIVQSFLQIRRTNMLPDLIRGQVQGMFDNKQYREVIDLTSTQGDFLSHVLHAALSEAPRGYPAMERALEEAAAQRTTKLLRSIEWLNLLGNIGPMMGLLGTVWGMILVFFKIAQSDTVPSPGALAKPLGIKLVCTLLGIVVAIPSLAVYGIQRTRIDGMSAEAMICAQELIAIFRPGAKAA